MASETPAAAARYLFKAPVSRIGIRPGRRPIDWAHVANLEVSFQEIGQRKPISLNLVANDDPARALYTYWLNAGNHRLQAAIGLGWADIDAILEDDDSHTAAIAEVDENLLHRSYTALERIQAVATRLEAWSARYPDRITADEGVISPKRGRPKKLPHGAAISATTMGFAEDAARAAGLSRDTIERDLAVYRGIPASLQVKLAGTPVAANPGALRQLAAVADKDEQARVAGVLLEGRAKSVSDAIAIAAGNTPVKTAQTPVDEAVRAFRKLWGSASPSAREAILADLGGRPLPKGWVVEQRG